MRPKETGIDASLMLMVTLLIGAILALTVALV